VSHGIDLITAVTFGEVIKLKFMQFSPSSFSFTSPRAQIPDHTVLRHSLTPFPSRLIGPSFLITLFLDICNLCPSLNVRSGFQPIQAKGQKNILRTAFWPLRFI
jgi:hypothetical protein